MTSDYPVEQLSLQQPFAPTVIQLQDSETDILTPTTDGVCLYVERLVASEVAGVGDALTLYLHAAGVAAGAGNAVCSGYTIAANVSVDFGPFVIPLTRIVTGKQTFNV